MAESLKQKARAYIRRFAGPLRLKDWKISLEVGRLTDDYAGQVVASPEYRLATVVLDSDLPHKELRKVVIHELSHLHIEQLARLAYAWAGEDKDKQEIVHVIEEDTVRELTAVFSKLLPPDA